MRVVKRAVTLILLLAALIGLFGQVAAYASIPAAPPAPTQMVGMSDDCMRMMAAPPSKPAQKPCKGLTLECIAAMGCVVPLALAEPYVIPTAPMAQLPAHSMTAMRALATREVAPDLEPPTLI